MTQAELLPALQFTPPVISLNFDELEASIRDITDKYTGLVVQESDVPAIKNEMAGLNKLAGQLADARKSAVSRISGPIKEFEDQVKGLELSIKTTRSFLDDQVQAHITRERECRRAAVQFIIDYQKDEHGCPGLEIPIQESWLNKTAKDKAITAEVQAIILAHKRQQEEKAALEQARKDRVVALEGHCRAMEQSRSYALTFSSFAHLQSLEIPLAEALAKVSEIYAAEDVRLAEIERRRVAAEQPKPEPHFLDMPEPPVQEEVKRVVKAMTITATYNAENGQDIGALYQRIKALCLTCTARVEEIPHA